MKTVAMSSMTTEQAQLSAYFAKNSSAPKLTNGQQKQQAVERNVSNAKYLKTYLSYVRQQLGHTQSYLQWKATLSLALAINAVS